VMSEPARRGGHDACRRPDLIAFARLRRRSAAAARPVPDSTSVAGSGTGVILWNRSDRHGIDRQVVDGEVTGRRGQAQCVEERATERDGPLLNNEPGWADPGRRRCTRLTLAASVVGGSATMWNPHGIFAPTGSPESRLAFLTPYRHQPLPIRHHELRFLAQPDVPEDLFSGF
jgi:hypothetical protein